MTSNRGFSLLEVVIAVGVGSVLTAATFTVIEGLNSAANHGTAKTGQTLLKVDLRRALSTREGCRTSLRTKKFEPKSDRQPVVVYLPQGKANGRVAAKAALPDYNTRVTRLDLVDPQDLGLVPNGDRMFSADLTLESSELKVGLPFQFAPAKVSTLYFSVNPTTNDITECLTNNSDQSLDDLSCRKLKGRLVDGVCLMPPPNLNVACKDDEYIQGFDSTGKVTCVKFAPPKPHCPDVVYDHPGSVSGGQDISVHMDIPLSEPKARLTEGCQLSAITVHARMFGGYGTCSVGRDLGLTALGRMAAFEGSPNPSKSDYGTAVWGANEVRLAHRASGFGGCNGNPCNACISNVQLVLHSKPQ